MQSEKMTAIYCRVARTDDYALETQKDYLFRYAEEHGFGNAEVYADNGYSGLSFDRPALLALEADIQAGKVQRVIVKDLSRITRDYIAADAWISKLIANGVAVITTDCPQPVNIMLKRYAALQ